MVGTLNMIFSVTCYLELRDVVSISCISHNFINKCQIGCLY